MKDIIIKSFNNIIEYSDEQHKVMLSKIEKDLPMINQLSNNFGKTQSQFMDNMLTTTHPTPLRNIRQILAEIEKSLSALKEVYYKNKKKEIEIKLKEEELIEEPHLLKKQLIEIEIEEMVVNLETQKKYIQGAIRKISNYSEQYNSILKNIGVESIDEIDFEKEEEEYHIKTAFEQGLNAARANNGFIDEGNQIYLTQLGINGSIAQKLVQGFLMYEEQLINNGEDITAETQWKFLEEMYNKFKGSSIKVAEKKGMKIFNSQSLLEDK